MQEQYALDGESSMKNSMYLFVKHFSEGINKNSDYFDPDRQKINLTEMNNFVTQLSQGKEDRGNKDTEINDIHNNIQRAYNSKIEIQDRQYADNLLEVNLNLFDSVPILAKEETLV